MPSKALPKRDKAPFLHPEPSATSGYPHYTTLRTRLEKRLGVQDLCDSRFLCSLSEGQPHEQPRDLLFIVRVGFAECQAGNR